MILASLAALGAALCWAFGGLIALGPVRSMGPIAFNRLRMVMVFAMLGLAATLTGGWSSLETAHLAALALSGLVGILVGDTLLFAGLQRLGPRRNAVVYASAAPMTAVLGVLLLGETLGVQALGGIALVTAGVMLAVLFGRRGAAIHEFEAVQGGLAAGIGLALAAALCQAAGTVIAKPVMAAGIDPVAAAAVRVGTAMVGLLATALLPRRPGAVRPPLVGRLLGQVALSGVIGMGLGMTLLLLALAQGSAGIVATLSSTTPVLILPLLWFGTGQRPGGGAWAGALLTVAGIGLILNR